MHNNFIWTSSTQQHSRSMLLLLCLMKHDGLTFCSPLSYMFFFCISVFFVKSIFFMLCLSRKSSFISQNELCVSFTSTFILHCLPLFHPQANAIEKRNNKFNCCMASSSKKEEVMERIKEKLLNISAFGLIHNTYTSFSYLLFSFLFTHTTFYILQVSSSTPMLIFYKVKNSLTYDYYSESQIIFFNIQKT